MEIDTPKANIAVDKSPPQPVHRSKINKMILAIELVDLDLNKHTDILELQKNIHQGSKRISNLDRRYTD